MRTRRRRVAHSSLVATTPAIARADLTAFLGGMRSATSPGRAAGSTESSTRLDKGLAVGISLVIVGFEFEWAQMSGDDAGENLCAAAGAGCVPSLMTGMGNVLVQTPRGVSPVQIYGTAGGGMYRERYGVLDENDYGFGTNVGGGVKIDLMGPLRLRIDYRIFQLQGDAFHGTPQRIYAGANLAF
jgi:opacity protein-like surface antigen